MPILNLRPEELAIFRRLAVEGPTKSEAAAELLDRGWAVYVDDHGTLALSADGRQIAAMCGLDRDGGAAVADGAPSSAAPTRT